MQAWRRRLLGVEAVPADLSDAEIQHFFTLQDDEAAIVAHRGHDTKVIIVYRSCEQTRPMRSGTVFGASPHGQQRTPRDGLAPGDHRERLVRPQDRRRGGPAL